MQRRGKGSRIAGIERRNVAIEDGKRRDLGSRFRMVHGSLPCRSAPLTTASPVRDIFAEALAEEPQ